MNFMPDYKKAIEQSKEYAANPMMFTNPIFGTYSCAFIVTTENLRQLPQLMPKKHEKVLTVACSGDHPLWLSLYGAKYVDTFDISYNAKIMMDIKTAALIYLSWCNYKRLLEDLYELKFYPCMHISQTRNMQKILPKLPKTESEYIESIESLGSASIFRDYGRPSKTNALPTFLEYIKLRMIVRKPYNFYMTDVRNLGNFLTTSYDVIHLSNVLDYVPATEHKGIILPLLNHVNPGGRIIAHNMKYNTSKRCYDNYFGDTAKEIASSLDNWQHIQKPIYSPAPGIGLLKDGTHILERVR